MYNLHLEEARSALKVLNEELGYFLRIGNIAQKLARAASHHDAGDAIKEFKQLKEFESLEQFFASTRKLCGKLNGVLPLLDGNSRSQLETNMQELKALEDRILVETAKKLKSLLRVKWLINWKKVNVLASQIEKQIADIIAVEQTLKSILEKYAKEAEQQLILANTGTQELHVGTLRFRISDDFKGLLGLGVAYGVYAINNIYVALGGRLNELPYQARRRLMSSGPYGVYNGDDLEEYLARRIEAELSQGQLVKLVFRGFAMTDKELDRLRKDSVDTGDHQFIYAFYGDSSSIHGASSFAISGAYHRAAIGREMRVEEFKERLAKLHPVVTVYRAYCLDGRRGGDYLFRLKEPYTWKDALYKIVIADLEFMS